MNGTNGKSIREKVAEAIQSGRVHMHSRAHFLMQAVLLAVGMMIVLMFLLYFASFTVAALRRSGAWFAPGLGGGWFELFAAMPWTLLLLSLVFLALLQLLVRRYGQVYRHSVIYSAIGIVLLAIAGGIAIAETPLHHRLFRYAEEGRLPYAGRLYRRFDLHAPRMQMGTVTGLTENGFFLDERRGVLLRVITGATTSFPGGREIGPGDTVVIFGEATSGTVRAIGVREIAGEEFMRSTHMPFRAF